ncbi:MAG TPA: biotin/lipoyl-binding protein [Thermoguttaceae bacterium]|nr:biotin/lipoyl-binding protein [Thermoguttaceae bacterium]
MVTLSDSLVSSSARKLPIRKRPDLSARRQQYLGRSYWVVKEPVGLNYYRFQDEEFAILNMLDGETSLDEIKERFEAEFPPQKITVEELQQFLGMLHRSGLVIAGVGGQGRQLRKRRDERRRKEILGQMTNILCIRFKGFDPERFLNWLFPKVAWLFSPAMLAICVLLMISAGTLVVIEFDVFRSKLPAFYEFFNFYNAMWLGGTLGIIKVMHEFGHGLTCKKFGGECHEMGVMILVLTPCLYCNVSDSWMLPNKWHRALIGAAGIIVEVTLASIATFIWWFTEPGLLNHICLNTMFLASVSTILFNGNPLLRYDGYYIMADLVEIPNLRQKATSILSRKLAHLCLGIEPPDDPFLPQRNQMFFALYSVAAVVYRWFILASILYFLFQVFKPYGLEIIGKIIVLMSLYGLIAMPAYKVFKFFYIPGRIEKVKKPRMYTSLAVLGAVVAAVLFVPLPYSVMTTLEIKARDAEPVIVHIPNGARLEEVYVRAGDRVSRGDPLARLSSTQVELALTELLGEHDRYKWELSNLHYLYGKYGDSQDGGNLRVVQAELNRVEEQLQKRMADQERLILRAPRSGIVLPPPTNAGQGEIEGHLPMWSGTPLEPVNLGAFLEEGKEFCVIGDPRYLEATLVIDQTDIEFVRENLPVEIKLDELPHDVLSKYGDTDEDLKIDEIANVNMKYAPPSLSTRTGGELATTTDPKTGAQRPQSTSFQARVWLEDAHGELRVGFRGRAKIHADPQPLGKRLWRLIQHTFNFKL